MKLAAPVVLLLLLMAGSAAADPVYLDQLMESRLETLQQQFPGLKKDGCYRIADSRYLWIEVDRRERRPWRIALASEAPCKRPEDLTAAMDVRHRKGVELGQRTIEVVELMGRPEASAVPEASLQRLGDTEYFYICRVSEGCARHTSVFVRNGIVTGIAEWYSE